MFLLLSHFASGHLPPTGKAARALKDVAVLGHCLTAGCRLFYTQAHLPLPLPLWGLDFKTAVSSPLCSMPRTSAVGLQTSNSRRPVIYPICNKDFL